MSFIKSLVSPLSSLKKDTMTIQEAIADFVAYVPKVAAFEAGQAISIPVAAASYDLDIPNVGKVKIGESGTTITIQKG